MIFKSLGPQLSCCCITPSFAQYDSSRLDVGYLHLQKDFTQTITIKGSDLERMPFTNLNEKRFTAGFDLLYHFGESVQSETYSGAYDTVKVNSVITPNIYIGYSWHLPGAQTLECFVESRGLIRSSTSDLLDDRRYYTVGGKLSL